MAKLVLILTIMLTIVSGAHGAEGVYVLNSSYSPPHSTPDQDGYLDLILKAAFGRAGLQARIQMLPAERSFQESNSGAADGEIGRIRGIEAAYPNLMIVDEPIIEARDFVAFSVMHPFETGGWESLKPYNVGYVRGWKIYENNIVEAKSLSAADSTEALFRMLQSDRVDVAMSARIDGLYTAKRIGLTNVRVLEPPLATVQLFLYLHRSHADIVPRIEGALREMKADQSFYRIRNKVLAEIMEK